MKQKTRILIYILVAIAVVIVGSIAIIANHNANKPVTAQEKIDLGHAYLLDLSYEKAVLEFTEAIEIEPMNADAYLGLAEAYQGMDDIDKAIEALETGYEKTGDQRLKDKLDELSPPEETTVTTAETTVTTVPTTITTTETTTTIELVTVPDLAGMTQKEALSVCEELGISCDVKTEENDTVEKDHVISQSVAAGANVPVNYAISVTVSEGKKVVTTSQVTTQTTAAANVDYIIIKGEKYSTTLTELALSGMGLTDEDIKDLNKMTNLTYLNLGFNYQISDISPLKNLTNLTELNLDVNQISDISPLKNLTNLTTLNLMYNQINDISALKNMTKLTNLYLTNNQVSNISPLKNLTNLTELYLVDNQISDISPIKNLTNLTELYLDSNQISDISPLKNLTNLMCLSLDGNQISDVSPLKNLTNLTSLDLTDNQISDVSPLKNLTNLTELSLDGNQISDISPLKNLTNLIGLSLWDNPISNDDMEKLEKALPNCEIMYY